jgi:hypothetical protein
LSLITSRCLSLSLTLAVSPISVLSTIVDDNLSLFFAVFPITSPVYLCTLLSLLSLSATFTYVFIFRRSLLSVPSTSMLFYRRPSRLRCLPALSSSTLLSTCFICPCALLLPSSPSVTSVYVFLFCHFSRLHRLLISFSSVTPPRLYHLSISLTSLSLPPFASSVYTSLSSTSHVCVICLYTLLPSFPRFLSTLFMLSFHRLYALSPSFLCSSLFHRYLHLPSNLS